MVNVQRNLPAVGRFLLGLIFVLSGLGKLGSWGPTIQYMEAKGFFLTPLFLAGAVAVEVIGGVMLIAGYRARLAAAALAGFTILAAFLFHAFWVLPQGDQAMVEMTMFMKNLSITGGLLMVVALGAGGRSFDARAAS
jgi:putative oxidoreductase